MALPVREPLVATSCAVPVLPGLQAILLASHVPPHTKVCQAPELLAPGVMEIPDPLTLKSIWAEMMGFPLASSTAAVNTCAFPGFKEALVGLNEMLVGTTGVLLEESFPHPVNANRKHRKAAGTVLENRFNLSSVSDSRLQTLVRQRWTGFLHKIKE